MRKKNLSLGKQQRCGFISVKDSLLPKKRWAVVVWGGLGFFTFLEMQKAFRDLIYT